MAEASLVSARVGACCGSTPMVSARVRAETKGGRYGLPAPLSGNISSQSGSLSPKLGPVRYHDELANMGSLQHRLLGVAKH